MDSESFFRKGSDDPEGVDDASGESDLVSSCHEWSAHEAWYG
jgi:hypothetical protein